MKKISFVFSLLLLIVVFGCQQPVVDEVASVDDSVPVVTEDIGVAHYESDLVAFDYPSEYEVFVEGSLEGLIAEEIRLMKKIDDKTYMPLDLWIAVPTVERGAIVSFEQLKEEYKLQAGEDVEAEFKELEIDGRQAFRYQAGGLCGAHVIMMIESPSDRDSYHTVNKITGSDCRMDQEELFSILDLFINSAKIKSL